MRIVGHHVFTAPTTSAQGLDFATLCTLIGNKLGKFDLPCPACSPLRRTAANRKKPVLRIWHEQPHFLTWCCAHCGEHGYAHEGKQRRLLDGTQNKLIREARERAEAHLRKRRGLAHWLWEGSEPITGTLAERYLRGRGIAGRLPNTLRFRPPRGQHPPAMIAAFGIPLELEPGVVDAANMLVREAHVTRLRPDGRGKLETDDGPAKVMIGPSMGLPIVLAPPNDIGGLAICEGIEDALSIHQATGLGAWAAGCANRLPALARVVPLHVESVTISVDDDDAGRRYAHELADLLRRIHGRRLEVIMLDTSSNWRAAA
jgi:hypothetical protein